MSQIVYSTITTIKNTEKTKIYLAIMEEQTRPVIIKRMKTANPEVYKVLAEIRNKYIPRIYAWEMQGDELVVAEEYVGGETLEYYLTQGILSEEQKLNIALQLCEAVEVLHNCTPRIIHRDIKPSNVLVTEEGVIKLIDFDASRQYKNLSGNSDTRILGTADYAAPEQFGYKQTDARSDIYSMGIVFEMLNFRGKGLARFLWKRMQGICTNFDPKQRYKSVNTLKNAVHRIILLRKYQWYGFCGVLCAVLLLGMGLWLFDNPVGEEGKQPDAQVMAEMQKPGEKQEFAEMQEPGEKQGSTEMQEPTDEVVPETIVTDTVWEDTVQPEQATDMPEQEADDETDEDEGNEINQMPEEEEMQPDDQVMPEIQEPEEEQESTEVQKPTDEVVPETPVPDTPVTDTVLGEPVQPEQVPDVPEQVPDVPEQTPDVPEQDANDEADEAKLNAIKQMLKAEGAYVAEYFPGEMNVDYMLYSDTFESGIAISQATLTDMVTEENVNLIENMRFENSILFINANYMKKLRPSYYKLSVSFSEKKENKAHTLITHIRVYPETEPFRESAFALATNWLSYHYENYDTLHIRTQINSKAKITGIYLVNYGIIEPGQYQILYGGRVAEFSAALLERCKTQKTTLFEIVFDNGKRETITIENPYM